MHGFSQLVLSDQCTFSAEFGSNEMRGFRYPASVDALKCLVDGRSFDKVVLTI